MKYANRVSEILNAFSLAPLKKEDMEEFYCKNTMEYRTSDKYNSPIEDIFDLCRMEEESSACLLLGHRGCGKSTELNKMAGRLAACGYHVKTVHCSMDLDLLSIVYSDLFILMGEALLQIAKELECEIDRNTLEKIRNFWTEGTETVMIQELDALSMEGGMSVGTKGILAGVLDMFAKIKTELKLNEETRKEYRRKISTRTSEWIGMLRRVAESIEQKADGKRPIIIFEDLDKLDPESAWKVFYHYAAMLSGMPFPVIYTFPIALSYDIRFSAMESYFVTKTLPMIKIETIEGEPFSEGIAVIREIVQKRAERRDSAVISMEDAQRALEEAKTSLTRRIEEKHYPFLLNIYQGNKERIADKEMLLHMLQASVVLEYNGKRWHNVHPLVVKFFEEQGMLGNARE